MINYAEEYYDHYNEYLGKAINREVYESDIESPQIQVLKYEKVFKDCMVYSTIGLTKYSEIIGDIVEISLVVDSAFDITPYVLANVLFYCIQNNITIQYGTAICGIENIDNEFSNKYDKSAIYFTEPYAFPEEFTKVCDEDGKEIGQMLLAFYISQKEYEYIVKNGYEEFEELLEKSNIDPFSVSRVSII